MKRNAIVTLYGEFNYGNRLQNYAITKCFARWNEEATTIVKKGPSTLKQQIKKQVKYFVVKTFKSFAKKQYPDTLREVNFKKFTKSHIPTTFYKGCISSQSQKYDRFIVGSDQVWNPCFDQYEDLYDQMFLIGIPQNKKSCFAPSFGVSLIPDEWTQRFSDGLNTFPKLCARESAGADIINELTKKSAPVMIDPTLMLDKKDWTAVSKKVCNLPDKFVLDYFLGDTPDTDSYHSVLSNKYGTQRIRLLDPANPDIYVSGPAEFIYLISKASLVCTDSFHACVFSIIFDKPFAIFKREGKEKDMSSRLQTLLALFGIDIKTLNSGDVVQIDHTLRDEVLSKKREEVYNFFNK
ncbi:MAG: polysaccharide pyruvyl transferase family protein [Clostridia bacterium]|nr:polysaccharide pyruvyl transferase family protein [Clostridia bacterium]